mmetsp:Transcript_3166/g.14133  ORF Transcript_3166/g.14133 Transcript_3166/m.14133 type:complete len:209 (-) Transcript_3166:232-858(-)
MTATGAAWLSARRRHGDNHEPAETDAEERERAKHRPTAPASGVGPVGLHHPRVRPGHLPRSARRARGVAQAGGVGVPGVPVPPHQPVPVHGVWHSERHRTVRPRSGVGHFHHGEHARGQGDRHSAHHQQESHIHHLLRGGRHLRGHHGDHPPDQNRVRETQRGRLLPAERDDQWIRHVRVRADRGTGELGVRNMRRHRGKRVRVGRRR